ncbi:BREX-2 system adenine-specific DNA-methyltransferase PglX [Corynebacterium variabile]|uniref:BREX-2 system adenine-specific DNA-methyltransferase PglX n=1 Tax=Corynebacterium variabile TaxID=1727 RepID=UPI00289EACF9|nr:BREX-2 system adenine-specific DNA-methyltransferase PglX [Corynebacterium variabile]
MARTTTGTAEASLTAALQPVIRSLVTDMRSRLTEDAALLQSWRTEHAQAQAADRVGTSFEEWSEEQLQQAAAGWVLTTVFLRFIEDNDLFGPRQVFLTGFDSDRRALGRDYEAALYQAHPDYSYRAYLQHCFTQLADVPATKDLVGPHAAIHIIDPSDDAARLIIEFFRAVDTTEDGEQTTRWTFNDPELSTRFLGDLYQDLSEFARKKYALLQTPDFVEEFILDRTLTPALEERPLEGFTMIDPTCGSGHFLLGAFHRLVSEWEKHAPALNPAERAEKAMEAIHGVDINPFAVAISQFRLTVAYMQAAQDTRLTERESKPGFTVLAGDSLLFGPDAVGQGALNLQAENFVYSTENAYALDEVLAADSYDVVVGNPPYITVKDKALNRQYRNRFVKYTKGKYALTVPFMVKFFQLAKDGNAGQDAGWVGQITSNSFMQRQFGKPLIEEFFGEVDLREVIDTSGAYIPGHGTPTAILVGRHSHPSRRKVIGVLGIQGEPGVPQEPMQGAVWSSIVDHVDDIEFEGQFISVTELDRDFIVRHPWSLSGGAAPEILTLLDKSQTKLGQISNSIGITCFTLEDSFFLRPRNTLKNSPLPTRTFLTGADIREWNSLTETVSLFPYDTDLRPRKIENSASELFEYWPFRANLGASVMFGGKSKVEDGLRWYEYGRLTKRKLLEGKLLSFSEVATHNHFTPTPATSLSSQSAPVIEFDAQMENADFFRNLGLLNSSTACFWMKQNCHNKGNGGIGGGIGDEAWEPRYQFSSTAISKFPLPDLKGSDTTERGRRLDALAQELATYEPAAVFADGTPTQEAIDDAEANYVRVRRLMIAEQEELDWACYFLYGLTDTDLSLPVGTVEGIDLGTRPFEIALARRVDAGETTTAWFERHHSHPVTDIPETWPEAQRTAAQERLELMTSDKSIKLLEAPEYKRRWADALWTDKVHEALSSWLLTRLETPELWRRSDGMPQPRTIRELAAQVETDPDLTDVLSVLPLWSTRRGATVEKMLDDLLKNEAVPYVTSLRYKNRGFAKRAEWEATWDAQRREDAGEITAEDVPVPPNYSSADMVPAVWKHRGKLDVPKERFISYPGASPEGDSTLLLGWAGWNDLDKGLAIFSTFADRADEDADTETLAGILAGLVEVLPWVKQWHNDLDPQFNLKMGDYLEAQLAEAARSLSIPIEDIPNHAPTPATRGRKKTSK